MKIILPKEVIALMTLIKKADKQIYLVGGSVRDLLLSRPETDWDFTTDAKPDELLAILPESFYENNFGTVSLTGEHLYELLQVDPTKYTANQQAEVFETTTFRSDFNYQDHRRPQTVEWGNNLNEDLQRRDFTINALALELHVSDQLQSDLLTNFDQLQKKIEIDATLHDPFQGWPDLQQRRIKAVGDPSERFEEDALRMLRAVRLAAQMELQIEQETLIALQTKAALIAHVSWERIRDEVLKILITDHVEDSFEILRTTGLLKHIMPELLAMKDIEQRGHHEHDVWTHSLRACQLCPTTDPIVRLAALLHDVAKPETQAEIADQPGEYSFHNHEVIGARVARDIARRLRLSKQNIQRIFILVRWHMFYYQPEMTDAAIRRFIRRVGVENIADIMDLREGDRLGSGSKRTSWRLEEMKTRIEEQLHQPMQVSDLAIDGHDVMKELDLQPGPAIGNVLNQLFEQVLENPELNQKEILLKMMKKQNQQS